ncbi:MAG: hypothetical protein ACOY3M_00305 [Patescibacteria group bacterium]
MTDDEKVAPAQFSQRSQKFHLTELLIGLFIGVLIGGGSVYVWQQRVWQPLVASLKSEYIRQISLTVPQTPVHGVTLDTRYPVTRRIA